MRNLPLVLVVAAVVGGTVFAGAPAHAAPNDVKLAGLVDTSGATPVARQGDFEHLATELALVLVPGSLQPAETTGIAGFDVGLDVGFHPVHLTDPAWRDGLEKPNASGMLTTLGGRVRKGFILPIPLTSEIEVGAQWILDSGLVNVGGNVRVALNEGFRYVPDLAVQVGVNRLIGSADIDLLTLTAGGQISKGFGVLGSFNLCPFVGYQSIWINAASHTIDATPANDNANPRPASDDVVFVPLSFPNARTDRVSGGLRLVVADVQVTGGVDIDIVNAQPLFHYSMRAGLTF
jgi:hypothetical protein